MTRALTISFAAAVCCLPSFAQEGSEPPIRVVLPGKGWSVGKKILQRGDTLSAITDVTGSGAESVDLVLDCGDQSGWLAYSCTKHPCRVPVCSTRVEGVAIQRVDPGGERRSPVPIPAEGFFSSLFRREPTALAVLGVREAGGLTDAVIAEVDGKVHLGPALARVLEGRYCLRFTPVPPPGGVVRTVTLDWDRTADSEGIVSDSNMPPGLYALQKGTLDANGACELDNTDAPPAWVLIVADAKFATAQAQWKAYHSDVLALERSAVSPTVLLTVRHAVLAHLADDLASVAEK